jgi:putative membrane protein
MTTMKLIGNYWHFNIWIILCALLLLFIHLWGNRYKLNKQSVLFFTGILLFLLSTLSPLDFLAESYLFSAHMLKHITLLLIIPALLLAGMNAEFLERIILKPGIKPVTQVIFHPVIAWFSGVGAMWLWHIPGLLGSVKTSPFLQVIHMLSLLILGLIFNWPVFTPVNWRKLSYLQSALYLFTACVGCTVLGILIVFAPAGMYTRFFTGNNTAILELVQKKWGISPDIDQQAGGLIMWVPACMIYLTDIMISLAHWYRTGEAED